MKLHIFSCILLFASFISCKKTSEPNVTTITTVVSGSPHTKAMCKSRSFRLIYAGYNPSSKVYESDTSNITVEVAYKDDATVFFDSKTYHYDSTNSAGTVVYRFAEQFNLDVGEIDYSPANDSVFVRRATHVSAAGGTWTKTYYSF